MNSHPVVLIGRMYHPDAEERLRAAVPVEILESPTAESIAGALREGWIAGAALDVYEDEPVTKDSPLAGIENLLLSPHIAGLTDEALRGMALSAAEQILQALRGERPPHLVNPEVWGRT